MFQNIRDKIRNFRVALSNASVRACIASTLIPGESWRTEYFRICIMITQMYVGDREYAPIDFAGRKIEEQPPPPSQQEADSLRSFIVFALAAAGNLAVLPMLIAKIKNYDNIFAARMTEIAAWARKNPNRALGIATDPIIPVFDPKDGTDEDVDKEKRRQVESGILEIIHAIVKSRSPEYVARWIEDVLPRYVNHDDEEVLPCLICQAQTHLAGALAATGNFAKARNVARWHWIPRARVATWLAVYKHSASSEDLNTARMLAGFPTAETYQDWIKIAQASSDPEDLAKLRTVANDPLADAIDFDRGELLVAIAAVTRHPTDLAAAREAVNAGPETSFALTELCTLTWDECDFKSLVAQSEKNGAGYWALASIANITGRRKDFEAAIEAALAIKATSPQTSTALLRGAILTQIAESLCKEAPRR